MKTLFNILKIVLLGTLLISSSGCASDDDWSHTQKTLDTTPRDDSYHGWNSIPKETDASQ